MAFLRKIPVHFLNQYLRKYKLLLDIDFTESEETLIESIFESWKKLPDNDRKKIEQDFQIIHQMATEGGTKAILDAGNEQGENLAPTFAELKGVYEHAFWTFLERPGYWDAATAFERADNISDVYWRKRKNFPNVAAHTGTDDIKALELALSQYFYINQGRGKNCKVEVYKRNGIDYFFAYPEDYAQVNDIWQGNKLSRYPYYPAFEIIFVYSQKDHTLDIYLSGERKITEELQCIFSEIILKSTLLPDEKDNRVYDLTQFFSRDFQFLYDPDLGIESIKVNKLRLGVPQRNGKIILESNSSTDRNNVYDLLEDLIIPRHQMYITQVGIKVTFSPTATNKRKKTRSFNIS